MLLLFIVAGRGEIFAQIDYSYCGYRNSNQAIPTVDAAVFVSHQAGDNSKRIQRAIDYVSSLPANNEGFRGAVLLDRGVFELHDALYITTPGVVLQGSDKEETILFKKGVDRGSVIYIEGQNDTRYMDTLDVATPYLAAGHTGIEIADGRKLRTGSRIVIVRPSTAEWIRSVGCDIFGGGISALGWKPGDTDLRWDRTVIAVADNRITIDAPLTVALDRTYGGAKLIICHPAGRINQVGVSNLTLISDYDRAYPKDEDHCWNGISIENAEDCWVRQVNFRHFAGSAVVLQSGSSRVTVEDCMSYAPVSEIGGMRRNTFLTYGQLTLFQRCYSEHGIHDYVAGWCAPGPNAFVQCESKESLGFSGAVGAWACGLLFDIVNIDGHNLTFKNLGQSKNGAGWNTANSTFWQCTAAELECFSPAGDAKNRAYGCWGQFSGNGEWADSNNHIQPRSLFYSQLSERLNKDVSQQARLLPLNTSASSSPTVEQAMQLALEARQPRLTLEQWIDRNATTQERPAKLKEIDQVRMKRRTPSGQPPKQIRIINGRLTVDGALLVGRASSVPWWNGKLRAPAIAKAAPHITRFVPGREGQGLTDRPDSVVDYMLRHNIAVLHHNYGLWYDRRRDDHQRVRRGDGDVWGPFYEQPFGRTNVETAWDGLSKYDLNRPNAWYWMRLTTFADKAESAGLLLFHHNYFQHNILEAGAHWVDCPWRSANNVNRTGFLEPVPFTGDKRIFVADAFYDVTDPVRRELHRAYIRRCLDNFAENTNVVQLISEEYTGPLHFMEFWIDVICEWEAETGKNAVVALSATKDVQDAILNDSARAAIVDIIDIRYWHYKDNGALYAPEGGKNLAPRQHARQMKVGKTGFDDVYAAVHEYRAKYPGKAVTYFAQGYPAMAWAVLMAGGSCPSVVVRDKSFLSALIDMEAVNTDTGSYKIMVKSGTDCVVYSTTGNKIPLSLSKGKYQLKYIDPATGVVETLNKSLEINKDYLLHIPDNKPGAYWICKK